MSNLSLRRLGPGDVPILRALNALFAEAFADPETYAGATPSAGYLEARLADERIVALVALRDGTVVGGLVGYVLDKLERARAEIYVYDLAVAAGHRRQGIATALIAHLRGLASACGAWVLFVQADHGDAPAVALYTGLGTREDVLHFDIAP